MRLPRDLGGDQLAALLGRYGHAVVRQTGSHIRLVSSLKGTEHNITVPRHKPLMVGTLSSILKDVASYLEMNGQQLIQELMMRP